MMLKSIDAQGNAEQLFNQHVKLYRFHETTRRWQKHGFGYLSIFRYINTGKVQLLMRRDQSLTICINHYILPEMRLSPKFGENAWVWAAYDFSEGKSKQEIFSARFYSPTLAEQFRDAFQRGQAMLSYRCDSSGNSSIQNNAIKNVFDTNQCGLKPTVFFPASVNSASFYLSNVTQGVFNFGNQGGLYPGGGNAQASANAVIIPGSAISVCQGNLIDPASAAATCIDQVHTGAFSNLANVPLIIQENLNYIDYTDYDWFFFDKNCQWSLYGDSQTTDKILVVSVNCEDIEKAYRLNPNGSMSFGSKLFQYTLDFKSMHQTNLTTRIRRPVMRRQKHTFYRHLTDEDFGGLPKTWEPMGANEQLRMVPLPSTSMEYQLLVSLTDQQVNPLAIKKIERVQNPSLWHRLDTRIYELSRLYKGLDCAVGVRHLFHGTCAKAVAAICQDNFDWKLHGTNVGHIYGHGTYFSSRAAVAVKYARSDVKGFRQMLVAQVAVGTCVAGHKEMDRPPINPVTGLTYESSCDRVANPVVIVKYDASEYCPLYVITFS